MKRALSVFLLSVFMLGWALAPVGCSIFQGTSQSQKASSAKTLKSVQIAVDRAMKVYAAACKAGKVSIQRQAEIDDAHWSYRGAFRAAVEASRNNLNAVSGDEVAKAANSLLLLIPK